MNYKNQKLKILQIAIWQIWSKLVTMAFSETIGNLYAAQQTSTTDGCGPQLVGLIRMKLESQNLDALNLDDCAFCLKKTRL